MEIEDNHQLKPLDELGIDANQAQYQESPSVGKLERRIIPKKHADINNGWLNKDNPVENFFHSTSGDDPQQINNNSEQMPYYTINSDFLLNVDEISNEFHRMFLEAINRVIHNDVLLARFGIPNVFWNRIRQSWINDQDWTINGQLDFAFDGKQLKLFEYNADNSTGLFESAVIQKKWPEAVGLSSTFTPVRQLQSSLINTWKKFNITTKVHISLMTMKKKCSQLFTCKVL